MSGASDSAGPVMGPMDFSTFVISLGSSVLLQLQSGNGDSAAQLELAKQSIDILTMLETKTAGNLTDEEGALLQSILYQTRMAYVEAKG